MRRDLAMSLLLGSILMLAGLRAAHADAAQALAIVDASGAIAGMSQGEPTPVIEPQPMPEPIFLPLTVRAYDPAAPGAISSSMEGFLASLSSTGRNACWPATHALLDKPEGANDARVLTVLRSARPGINLDFYVGDYVAVEGVQDLAPAGCRVLTHFTLEVAGIESIDIPPGRAR